MPGALATIGISAGASIVDYLLGANPETMTPEERRAYEYILGELQKSDVALGFSPEEKMGFQEKLKTGIADFTTEQIGQGTASLARRGAGSPGQTAALTTSATATGGEAFGQGLTDIELASAETGRKRKDYLTGLLPGAARGRIDQSGANFGGDLASYISNLAFQFASRRNKPDQNQATFSSGIRAPSLWGNVEPWRPR